MAFFNSFQDNNVSVDRPKTCQSGPACVVWQVGWEVIHGGLVFLQNLQLVADGCCNLEKQIQIAQLFGVPVVVALNVFR